MAEVAAVGAAEDAWVFAMVSRLVFERFEDGFAQAAARVRGVGGFVDAVLDELFADGIIDREAIVGREVLEVRGQAELFEERLLFRSKWHRFPFVVRENYSTGDKLPGRSTPLHEIDLELSSEAMSDFCKRGH